MVEARHRRGQRGRGGTAGGDDRVDVVVVAGAAADVAGHRGARLFGGRVRRGVQQRLRAHQLARRAEAALRRIVGDERPLQRIVQQSFDGLNGAAVGPHAELAARIDRLAVEQDRARAALAAVAADLGAGQLEVVAQRLDERPAIFDLERALRAVHGQRDARCASQARTATAALEARAPPRPPSARCRCPRETDDGRLFALGHDTSEQPDARIILTPEPLR